MQAAMYAPLALLLALSLAPLAAAHALMALPQVRGTLRHFKFNRNVPEVNSSAPADFLSHFPSGDKCIKPGCGVRSQEREAGRAGWTPFTPLEPSFRWRYGVCGDLKKKPDHLRGGVFYNHAQVVAEYPQAGVVSVQINVLAHHNGFMELHVCDVARCGGEISEDCFRAGHCYPLPRARNPKCDAGTSKRCAPVDRAYPGRWYFPCSTRRHGKGLQSFGGPSEETILYRLPENLACEHCVLQWFWSAANACNPRGVVEFFDGPDAPRTWGMCPGQAGALGGVTRVQQQCGRGRDGRQRFPEEYVSCADITILPRSDESGSRPRRTRAPASPTATPTPSRSRAPSPRPNKSRSPSARPGKSSSPRPRPIHTPVSATDLFPSETPEASMEPSPEPSAFPEASPDVDAQLGNAGPSRRNGGISDIVLIADGEAVRSVNDGDEIDVSSYYRFTLEAKVKGAVPWVEFRVDGEWVRREYHVPYILTGNRGRRLTYWRDAPLNREIVLTTRTNRGVDKTRITLVKR